MLGLVMMQLGAYQFGVFTAAYQSLRRTDVWRWPAQQLVGRPPAHQYVGPDATTIDLDGVIYPHYRGGLGQIDRMRAEADAGQPRTLIDGMGWVWGYYVITEIAEAHTEHGLGGLPIKIEFLLKLARYIQDPAAQVTVQPPARQTPSPAEGAAAARR